MNKLRYYIAIPLLLLLIISIRCTNDDEIGLPLYIRILSAIERPDLRVSDNNFKQEDQIGVFVVPYEQDNITPGMLGESNYANNVQHIYRNNSWITEGGNLLPWPGARDIDIYAYHPYNPQLSDPLHYHFSISENQSEINNYMISDFLYARNLKVPPSASVPLIFSHGLSKVNINVRSDLTFIKESLDFTSVFIQHIIPECQINLEDGSATETIGASEAEITPFKLSTPATNFDLSLTAVIPPQIIPASTPLLRVNNRGINYIYITEREISFEQGYTLTFNIDIKQQGIIVTSSVINEWYDGGTISGIIGEPAPRILDLNSIDWNRSYVHYIYDGNTVIGQVCREYLSRNVNPLVDLPAIVIYPLGIDGKPDLTNGFAARVYNRNRNMSTNQYEFNPDNIHGGRVIFGPKDTLHTYREGSLPLVNKVRIETTREINAAQDNAIPTLTAQPYTLTDVDNNVYPITKIGTQYWIRENFKAEHYSNGEPLQYYYYNNDPDTYKELLGAYYTWPTVTDPAGMAPIGWRVPTRADWNSLYHYVNPLTGKKIKALSMWATAANADDVTGFSGLPAGRRTAGGAFNELYSYGQWWSSTPDGTNNAWRIYASDGVSIVENSLGKTYTQSVRLMKDNGD